MSSQLAVVMAVGPGKQETERTADTLASLAAYEPDGGVVLLVDDDQGDRGLDRVLRSTLPQQWELHSMENPRRGRNDGWAGGLSVGVLGGIGWIHRNRPDVDLVLKLDTDTLVIAPFVEKLVGKFAQRPDLGLVGSYLVNPDGRPRNYTGWTRTLESFLKPICLRGRYLQITTFGRPRTVRLALEAALRNGYEMAQHCQGGGYALTGTMMRRLGTEGHLEDPLCWLRSGCTEDVMMGMYCHAVRLRMADFNAASEPFGVQYQGLAYPPETLRARGYSIIHSVKDCGELTENDTRRYFRSLREGAG